MAILNFPASPSINETYTENGVTYVWTGTYWTANTEAFNDVYVNVAGDTMTGDLNLPNLVATGDIQSTSQNGGPLAGFRNHIINGDFRIWQRGTAFTLAGQTFTADRWLLNSSQAKNTDQLELTQPCQFRYRLRTGVPATSQGSIIQPIEIPGNGSPGPFINGSVWTFSFWSNADFSAVAPGFKFSDSSSSTANVVAVTGVPTFTESGETLESNTNYKRWTCTFTINVDPLASNDCLTVQIPHTSFGTININYVGFQLEPGPVATPFEHRPIGTELALCQRYYLNLNSTSVRFPVIQSADSPNLIFVVPTPVTMRTTPTVIGSCSKIGVNTGSGYGTGTCIATASVFNATGVVRLSGSAGDFTATSNPVVGRVNGALNAEL